MKRLLIPLLAVLTVFSGCTISEQIYFNKDFSGEATYSFDLTTVRTFAETDTSDFGADIEKSMEDAKKELEAIEGITDIRSSYNDETSTASIKYKFKDVDALNRSFDNKESFKKESSPIPQKKFELKGNKLIYTLPEMPKDSTYEQMGEMKDMFQYQFSLKFENEIKKVKYKNGAKDYLEQSEDTKELLKKGNIYEVFPENDTEIIITLKK